MKSFEKKNNYIPSYDLVLVDEFQDFNKLEVSLIDLLASKSPILLSGDDDQAIYNFKGADTRFIREMHSAARSDYQSFNLPYCSRCTRIVVTAINDIIENAKRAGFLSERIDKPYVYFDCKKKEVHLRKSCRLLTVVISF